MSDLIKRSDAIKAIADALRDIVEHETEKNGFTTPFNDFEEIAANMLRDVPDADVGALFERSEA